MVIFDGKPEGANYAPLSRIFLQIIFGFLFFSLENQHNEKRITRHLM
jgi:hypothetical protein